MLASAVEAYWTAGSRLRARRPYHRLAADVWDLLRQDGGRFQRLCEQLPREALALIIGGSPCQDVSPMGPGRGRSGLCGERSIHFFVSPVLAWAITRARPDLVVHVVVENAGSIRPEHQAAMLAALGLRQDSGHAQIFDAAGWTSMPRRRTFLSTLAPVDGRRLPARRPQPWDKA